MVLLALSSCPSARWAKIHCDAFSTSQRIKKEQVNGGGGGGGGGGVVLHRFLSITLM